MQIHRVVEAIGRELGEESKVRNNSASYDVSIMMNVKRTNAAPLNTSQFG